ncbi:MAG: hypothetical protein AB9844_01630 [Clostridiaceae bacterium]
MKDKKNKNQSKYMWAARILSIMTALIVGSLTLSSFTAGAGLFSNIISFIMHSVPSLVILGMVIIFWKDPIKAGFGMFIAAMGFLGYYKTYQSLSLFLLLTLIPALATVFYIYTFIKTDRAEYSEMQEAIAKMQEKKQKLPNHPVRLNAKQKAKIRAKQKDAQEKH